MAVFDFVSKKGQDILQEVSMPCEDIDNPLSAHSIEPDTFGYRVVFGFFEGQFIADEIDSFMQDLALSPGTAPVANEYFKSYNAGSRVSTGGISFQKNMYIPGRVLEIIEEYRDVKFIDKLAFQWFHAEWFGSLSALQATRLLVKEAWAVSVNRHCIIWFA